MNPMKNSGRDTQPSTRMRTNRGFSYLSTFDPNKQTYKGQSEYNIKMQIHNVF